MTPVTTHFKKITQRAPDWFRAVCEFCALPHPKILYVLRMHVGVVWIHEIILTHYNWVRIYAVCNLVHLRIGCPTVGDDVSSRKNVFPIFVLNVAAVRSPTSISPSHAQHAQTPNDLPSTAHLELPVEKF